MQTFLPFADFTASARALDPQRLGKQRVEVLQLLRAIELPQYGWANHPATRMWRGFTPALVGYGLAMVDEWVRGGRADATRPLIAEFSPAVDHGSLAPALPPWFGDDALHRSHRSNLLRKDPLFYGEQFPGEPDDLPYVWPVDAVHGAPPPRPEPAHPVWLARPRKLDHLRLWLEQGLVTLADVSPLGRLTPGWEAQLGALAGLPEGAIVGVIEEGGTLVHVGEVVGGVTAFRQQFGGDSTVETGLARAVQFSGVAARQEFPRPALLQDPRSLFAVDAPAVYSRANLARAKQYTP